MKNIITISLVLLSIVSYAQERVSIAAYQDVKFATIGDKERGYDAFTTDVVVRLKLTGKQQSIGYLTIAPEFEYADLETAYKRYSFNIGYTFNKFSKHLEFTPMVGYGLIDRLDASGDSFGASAELSFKLSSNTKINFLGQFTQRKDLKILYNDDVFRGSFFVGLEIGL